MGKVKKTHHKQKFNYNKNRRRAWKNSKKMPTIQCEQIKDAWDEKKTVERNLRDMGLSADPNKTLPIPRTKDMMGPALERLDKYREPKKEKGHVADGLQSVASRPQKRRVRLSQPDVQYCIYMMEKHGDNYKAMAKDEQNYYQDTPKQIKKKIMTFQSIPEQYNKYLKSKESGEAMEADEDSD